MFEKEAKERAKDFTDNKERQVAYECGFLDGADRATEDLKKHNEELIALINAERERQEKCNDIHLQTIAELEKENDSLKETIRKGTSCGDWNDDVHTCQMYLKQEQLQECSNQLTEARKLIQKLEKQNEEMAEDYAETKRTRDNLRQIGFPTFQSCKEYADKLNYAKAIIKDLLDNSDEYARQRASDFLKED